MDGSLIRLHWVVTFSLALRTPHRTPITAAVGFNRLYRLLPAPADCLGYSALRGSNPCLSAIFPSRGEPQLESHPNLETIASGRTWSVRRSPAITSLACCRTFWCHADGRVMQNVDGRSIKPLHAFLDEGHPQNISSWRGR